MTEMYSFDEFEEEDLIASFSEMPVESSGQLVWFNIQPLNSNSWWWPAIMYSSWQDIRGAELRGLGGK
jgi:hypothetical protein